MARKRQLDETAKETESYNFQNVNPKVVFLLALVVAFASVCFIYISFAIIQYLIGIGWIPRPPSLGQYVS